ncbi:Pycsar system effector family protein [Aurantimonas sp. 22II-16-19i]|uniref:Pycsar system effector family protein n=1 Tax=Aurantimonas sp. 22II-16-19i TaxID=1317114 RepID=UPI0009F7DB33|nr:Pycsar system effector family protein [Aurantimonas sp. 22II-16-19i]ORE98760.1 hypothetical protein ATO4_00300 [Aurantimonas sp. 22II-16-19i]
MSERHLAHLVEANRMFADQIRTADQKAAYIFTFILALVVWSAETRRSFSLEHIATTGILNAAAGLVLMGAVGVSLVSALCVVLPRSRPGTSILFWGAWPGAATALDEARRQGDTEFLYEDYMQNTKTLAAICQAKYRMVAIAFRAMFVVFASYIALLMTG